MSDFESGKPSTNVGGNWLASTDSLGGDLGAADMAVAYGWVSRCEDRTAWNAPSAPADSVIRMPAGLACRKTGRAEIILSVSRMLPVSKPTGTSVALPR